MKQIFTLVLATALSFTAAFSQTTQTFENVTTLTTLTDYCWGFRDVALSTSSKLNDANSLEILPTTSTGISAWVQTPYINLSATSTISFNYKLSNKLSTTASRTISVRLQDFDGSYISLATISLTNNSNTQATTFSVPAGITGVKRLVIDILGNGDGNSYLYLDNIFAGGTFNYNTPYNCNTTASAALSIHYLKSFQGLLTDNQVQLQWSVAENENNNYFEIERSTDSRVFTTIAIVVATQNPGDVNYGYKDPAQTKAFYRLKVVSRGGKVGYSNVLFFKSGGNTANTLNLLQNPVQQTLKFSFQAESNTLSQVTVYNVQGVKVHQTSFRATKGTNSIALTLDGQLKKGTYLLEVVSPASRSVVKFLKD